MGETQSKSAQSPAISAAYDVEAATTSRLLEASQRGQTELVTKLLRKGKKINKIDDRGDTALHKAAACGHLEIVNLLLKKHPELVSSENFDGLTPFHLAAQFGKIDCARVLLDAFPKLANLPFAKNPVNFDYSLLERSGKITWTINHFSRIEDKKVYSDVFQLGGHKWRLVLYPRGSKGDANLSLYLEVANHEKLAEGWSHLVSFTFGVVNQFTGTCKLTREVVAHRFYKNHTDLGFPQMVKHSALNNPKFGLLVKDRLQVSIALKALDTSVFGLEENCGVFACRLNGFSKTKDQRMISNVFYVSGVPWALAVYPKGKLNSQTLSIYLKVLPPSTQPHYISSYSQSTTLRDSTADQEEPVTEATPSINVSSLNSAMPSTPSMASSPPSINLSSSPPTTSQIHTATTTDPNGWYYVVNFRISLINQLDGTKFTRAVDAKVFKHKSEDWGFPQFIKLTTLLNADNGFIVDDAILVDVALEVVDCVRPVSSLPTSHLISTLPSTPSFIRPNVLQHIAPSNATATNSATLVPINTQTVASFTVPLRKPFTLKNWKSGATWQVDSVIKALSMTPLHWAVYNGSLEAVSELLSRQANVDTCDANGRTPLDWACYHGYYDLAKLLLSHNASPHARDFEHAKAIHKAAYVGSSDVVQLLLHHHASVEDDLIVPDKKRKASLSLTQSQRDEIISTHAHEPTDAAESTIMAASPSGDSHQSNNPRLSPPATVVIAREPSPMKPNKRDDIKELDTMSVSQGDPDMSEDGVVSSLKTETGGRVLHLSQPSTTGSRKLEASTEGSSVASLRRHSTGDPMGASSPSATPTSLPATAWTLTVFTPLQICLRSQKSSLAEQIVEDFDGNVNCMDMWGRTPLHTVAYIGEINLLELFLSKCHPQLVNYQDKDGFTPLHKAVARGWFDCVQVLLNAGADVGLCSRSGYTPFHYAVLLNEFVCAKMILEFDRRRGTAPVPLRDIEAGRRASDVVESDLPLPTERKRATVSINDTIQLHRPDANAPLNLPLPHHTHAAQPSNAAPSSLHRSASERVPVGILHHPPGSEAAIAKQLQQIKRARANSSDEEPFEAKDATIISSETETPHAPSSSSAKSSSKRRSVNFHGDNTVLRIKHATDDEAGNTVGHEPTSTKRAEDAVDGASEDEEDVEGEESSAGGGTKYVDDGGLSADSQSDAGDHGDDDHPIVRRKRRASTSGASRGHRSAISDDEDIARLSDDEFQTSGAFASAVINTTEELDVYGDDAPEESSDSMTAWRSRPPSEKLSYRENRGRSLSRSGFARPQRPEEEDLEDLELMHASPSQRKSSEYTAPRSVDRKEAFSKSRSRSTGAVASALQSASSSSAANTSVTSTSPPSSTGSPQSHALAHTSSGELPKRISKFLLKALSGKNTDAATSSPPQTHGPSSSLHSSGNTPTNHHHSMDSEGARLKRSKVRRSSSSSSLESHAIVARSHISPPSSPPVSPTHAPKSSKLSFSALNTVSTAGSAKVSDDLTIVNPTPVAAAPSSATTTRRSRKSRSPPPAGRRPKSGSISTAERDHALMIVSPRANSPRPALSHSAGSSSRTVAISPPPTEEVSAPPATPNTDSVSSPPGNVDSTEVKPSHTALNDTSSAPSSSSPNLPQKKRSKGSKSKTDLKVQVNHTASTSKESSLVSPLSPDPVSPRLALQYPPTYSPQELLQIPDVNGWMPIHTSVKQGNLTTVRLLLAKDASVQVLANGFSVVDLAIQNQDATLTTTLLERGSPIVDAGTGLQAFVAQKVLPPSNFDYTPPIPPSTFVSDMRALLNNPQFFDVTFMVEGKAVYGWKGLLATRCEVFRAMFTGALREATESHVTITDVSYNTFYHIIEFIYTDSLSSDKMTLDDALQLLAAANRYILERLKRIIERWLISQLSDYNVGAIFYAADLHQAHHLRSACILHVAANLHRIADPFELLNGTFRGVLLDFLKHPTHN